MTFKPPRILGPRATSRAPVLVNTLETEIFEEKAATLSRLTRAFEAKFSAWRDAEAAAGAGCGEPPSERQRQWLFDEAADALWQFVVQREACGLKNTEAVLREYKVPAALRLTMGASRRA